MSQLERAEVERVARLARLTLSEAEIERLRGEMGDILRHVDELPETEPAEGADAAESAPADGSRPGAEPVALRADVPGSDALAFGPEEMAPEWRAGFFVVPRLPAMRAEDGGSAGG